MTLLPREKYGAHHQAGIVISTFQQNNPARALKLIWPVLLRRLRESAQWCLSPLTLFTTRQRLLRNFIASHLAIPAASRPQILGNYAAYTAMLTPESVVYSFGVGGDIRFDLALIESASCTVHLFDPTPRSARFMTRFANDSRLQFHPWGVWTKDGPVRLFSDVTLMVDASGTVFQDYRSGSITNITASYDWFEAECLTLPSITQKLGHRHIDLLKMDIEGAALEVIEHLWTTNLRPRQIIVEFEAPPDLSPFLSRLEILLTRLKSDGYFLVPLDRGSLYTDSIELLAVRS
tara:strand:- start:22 stop:894 length:873 start_codon:yes stop_codon:yes gene_type:complete